MKIKRFFVALYAVLLLLAVFPAPAYALGTGAYHPPGLTFLVYHAPKDLQAGIEMEYEGDRFPVTLEKETRLWETQLRLYREGVYRVKAWFGNDSAFAGAELLLQTGGQTLRVPIPAQQLSHGSEDVLSYDFRTGELRVGTPAGRDLGLFALRVGILLLVKGLVLFLYGYRRLRSWLGFAGVNLVTMGIVSWIMRSWMNVDAVNTYPLFFVGMLVVLLVEILSLVVALDEFSRNKAVSYATAANLSGCAVLFLILTYFPL